MLMIEGAEKETIETRTIDKPSEKNVEDDF